MRNPVNRTRKWFLTTAAVAALSVVCVLSARPARACPDCDFALKPGTYTLDDGDDIATCRKAVPAAFAAAGYVYAPGTEVPMMGGHWVDPKAPELNGQVFTKTFLYGSYNGKMIHFEPMITKHTWKPGRTSARPSRCQPRT